MTTSSKYQEELEPYDVEEALKRDAGSDCVVIDIGQDQHGQRVASLPHLAQEIELFLIPAAQRFTAATKLYVIGEWVLSAEEGKEIDKNRKESPEEAEWTIGIEKIIIIIKNVPDLKEFTWMATLPFMEAVWPALPKTLTKLVVNLDNPVHLDTADGNRRTYISHDAMRPLTTFTKLEQLRIFGMHDSFQSIIWETVYRNDADSKSMDVLDLSMKLVPLVRRSDWLKAEDVKKLTVAEDEVQPYKGIDGKGVLHYERGTGEYLDDLCIRRARNASNIDTTKALPLWCLKLDGFVVDHLPFKEELSQIVLLVCGEKCIDAGLRAPKTAHPHNKWRDWVKDTMTHCAIKFPKWAGVFDAEGNEHDVEGNLISSTENHQAEPSSPSPVLTALQALELQTLDRSESAISIRGSPVPTPSPADTVVSPTASFSSYDVVEPNPEEDAQTVGSITPAKEKQRRPWQFWNRKSTNSNETE